MKKTIIIMPKRVALAQLPDDSADYIFCTMDRLEIKEENVLHLSFLDTEEPFHPYAFSQMHANEIWRFINREGACDTLCVSCDSGESRSPAIAAAILLLQNDSDSEIWTSREYHPNRLVYKRCCEAWELMRIIK